MKIICHKSTDVSHYQLFFLLLHLLTFKMKLKLPGLFILLCLIIFICCVLHSLLQNTSANLYVRFIFSALLLVFQFYKKENCYCFYIKYASYGKFIVIIHLIFQRKFMNLSLSNFITNHILKLTELCLPLYCPSYYIHKQDDPHLLFIYIVVYGLSKKYFLFSYSFLFCRINLIHCSELKFSVSNIKTKLFGSHYYYLYTFLLSSFENIHNRFYSILYN